MKSCYRWKSRNLIALTREDADAFSDALRGEFPAIRILPYAYEEPWIDHEASAEQRRLVKAGKLPPETPLTVMRHPAKDSLPYLPSLGEAVLPSTVWIEPQGWRPRWSSAPNRAGIYTIINRPRLQFEFTRSSFVYWNTRRGFDDPPDSVPEDDILVLMCHRMVGRYRLDDKKHQSFLRRVWRILDKHTTTELTPCDLNTRKPLGVSSIRDVWAGIAAVEWMRRDSRHYISDGGLFYRPPECGRAKR